MPEESRSVGPYRLLGLLGRGSAGAVYRARHAQGGQIVALKTLPAASEAFLPTLRREVHALSRLRHPGIVRILDSGTHEGLPWLALELIEGPDLREACGRAASGAGAVHALSLPAVLTLVRRLCDALGYLHGEGLVHRDLKPDNILIQVSPDTRHPTPAGGPGTPPGISGMPVLVDFGVASEFSGLHSSRETLLLEGSASGTLLYMAPEQIEGRPLDARADLYSLGCVLYELLCGQPPFEGSAWEVCLGHLERAPRRLSERSPSLPSALEDLVLRLLSKDPRGRPGYATDVAAVLAALGAQDGWKSEGPRPRAYLYRPGFSGRSRELDALHGPLEQLRAGRGGLMLIGGESGAGKTRLLVELGRQAGRRGFRVLAGEGLPPSVPGPAGAGGGAPLAALRKPLQAMADRCLDRGVQETQRLLGRWGKLLALYEPSLGALPGLEAQPAPVELPAVAALLRLCTALADSFSALARVEPLVLLLDDLQWADELSTGFLQFLMDSGALQDAPLLVIGAYRSEERSAALGRLLDCGQAGRLELGRLEVEALARMIGEMLALDPPPDRFVGFLARQSEGNPFFVTEYLRAAVAEEVLYRDAEGFWQIAEPSAEEATEALFEALSLPASLQELVLHRLEALSAEARKLVEAAAVLGREADEALLGRVAGVDGEEFLEATEELLLRQVMEEAGGRRLRFVHDKIREVAYERLAPGKRRQLHRAAARALQERFGSGEGEHLAALGQHWERSGSRAKARPCYFKAARQARLRYDHGEAERLYRAYLKLVKAPTQESLMARHELGFHVLGIQGRNSEALAEFQRTAQDAVSLGDRHRLTRILAQSGNIYRRTGRLEEARTSFQQALGIARETGRRDDEVFVLEALGLLEREQGRLQEAESLCQSTLALYRETGNRIGEGSSLGYLAIVRQDQGRLDEALALYEQALEIFRELGDRRLQGNVLGNLANNHSMKGRMPEARRLYEQALALNREVGDRRNEGYTLGNLAVMTGDEGRIEEALLLLEQALAVFHATGDRAVEATALGWRARLERLSGKLARAERCLAEAEPIHTALGNPRALAQCLCEKGHIALARGQSASPMLEQAEELCRQAREDSRSRLSQSLERLRQAAAAFAAGRPLFQGELVEELPEGLRQRLAESGQLTGS